MLENYSQAILVAQEQRKDFLRNAQQARLAHIVQCGKTHKWWHPFGNSNATTCKSRHSQPLLLQCQIGKCPKYP